MVGGNAQDGRDCGESGSVLRNRYLFGEKGDGYDLFKKEKINVHIYDRDSMIDSYVNDASRERGLCLYLSPDFPTPDQLEAYLRGILQNVGQNAKLGGECDVSIIYDCIIERDKAYIITNHPEGISLEEYLGKRTEWKTISSGLEKETPFSVGNLTVSYEFFEKKLDISTCIEMMMPLIDSIICGHAKGIVYQDICMKNLIVTQDSGKPVVKRISFGDCAAAPERETWRYEEIYGKQGYSDAWRSGGYFAKDEHGVKWKKLDSEREKTEVAPYVGRWTDVYMLACVILQCLTGKAKLTFSFDLPDEIEDSLEDVADDKVRDVLKKALQPKIENRIQKMETFKTELEAVRIHPSFLKRFSSLGRDIFK